MATKLLGGATLLRTTSKCVIAVQSCCNLTTAHRTNYVSVTMDPDFEGSVAIVKLQKKPVNSLCANHLKEITKSITDLENNENVRAMIITSAHPGVFCAGLDIMSLYKKNFDEIYEFWPHFQNMMIKNLNSRLITVAAMNGHSIAGGCVIAFGCDYRVMADNHLIGLNEAKLGLSIPFYLKRMTINLAGVRQADKLFQTAALIKSREALELGLVDEVVPMDEVMTASKKHVAKLLEIPDVGRTRIKEDMQKEAVEEFHQLREADVQYFSNHISSKAVQSLLQKNIEILQKKKQPGN